LKILRIEHLMLGFDMPEELYHFRHIVFQQFLIQRDFQR